MDSVVVRIVGKVMLFLNLFLSHKRGDNLCSHHSFDSVICLIHLQSNMSKHVEVEKHLEALSNIEYVIYLTIKYVT